MSSNRINVNLAFNAETGKAKQQIQELQTLLSKIAYQGATTSSTDKLSTDLHQASEAAKELQFHLNNAFNATTGNFDLSLLDKSLKTSSSNITDLSTKLLSAGQTGQQAFLKLAQSISMADQPMFKINNKLKELGVSIKNAARWQISSNIIHGLQGGIQSAYNYAQDLNKSLNNIRIVTGYNVDKMAEFAEQANKAAKALSTTTTDYTDASLIYFQQGLNDAKVQDRTDTTIKLANVTGQSVEETANQMTAIWNNFDDGSKSLDYYADVITALGAATASSSKEISEGLNKFSAIAESVGLSYEYASAALATVTATTRQSADIVGNSFKTLFARIQGLNLGETLDDGTTLNKYSEALFKVGINIKDQSGQLKDMNTILDEMGSKWNTLGKDQQVALAQTVGGVRQYTQLIALMDNWDDFQQNLGVATGAEGTLNKQAEIYAESWEAAEKRVQAAAEGIYQSLLDDKFFISLNNGFANALNGIDAFIDGAGGVKTVLTGIASVVISTFAYKIPQALDTFKYNLTFLTKSTKDAYQDIQDKMAKATKMAFTGFENKTTGEKVQPIKEDSALGYQITAANELTAARSKLALVSDRMSDSEKQMTNTQLNIIEAAQEELVVLKQKNEALAESIKLQQESIQKSSIDNTTKSQSEKAEIDILALDKNVQKRYQEAANVFNKALNAVEIPDDLGALSDQQQQLEFLSTEMMGFSASYEEAVAEINSAYGSLGQNIFDKFIAPGDLSVKEEILEMPEWFTAAFNEIKSTVDFEGFLDDEFNFTTVQQQIVALSNTIPKAVQEATGLDRIFKNLGNKARTGAEFVQGFKELEKKLQNCKIEGKDFQKVLEGLYGKNKIGQLTNDMDKLAQNEAKAAEKAGILKNLLNEFNPQHVVRTSEALGALAGMAGSAVTAINGIISIFKSWTNPDLSGWEKISTTLMGISMTIPAVMSTISGYTKVLSFMNTLLGGSVAVLNLSNGARARLVAQIGKENLMEIANIAAKKKSTGASREQAVEEMKLALIKKGVTDQTQINTAAEFISSKVYQQSTKSVFSLIASKIALIIQQKLENKERQVGIILQTILNTLTGQWGGLIVAAGAAIIALIGIGLVKWLDNVIVTQKEANEAIAKSTEKYEEQKSKLDELKNELQSVNDQIAELNSQDQLDIVSQAELDKLEARRASLEAQVALQERLAAAAQREQANTISENWDKSSGLTAQPSQNGIIKGTDWTWTDGDSRSIYTQLAETLEQYQKRVGYNPETGEFDANRNYTDDQITKMTTFMQQWEIDNQAQMDKWRSDNQKQYLQNEADYDVIVAAAQVGNYTWKQGEKEQMQSDLAEQRKAIYGEDYDDLFIKPLLNAAEQVSIAKGEDGKYSVTGISQEEMDLHGISQGELDTWLNDQIAANPDAFAELEGIQDLDFSKLTSDQLFLLFDNLEQLEHFNGSSMEELITYLTEIQNIEPPKFDLESWKADYAKKMDIIKDLKTGDSISAEDYALLGEEYQQYFQVQADGTAILTAKAEDLLATVQQIEIGKLTGEIKQAQDKMHGYNTNENGKLILDNRYISTTNARGALDSHNAGWSYRDQDLIDYTSFVNEQYGQSFNTSNIEGWEQAIAYMEQQNVLLEEQQELLAGTATSQDQLNQYLQQGLITQEQYNQNFTETIIKEAQSIDIDVDELMAYADYLQQINPELKDNIQLSQKMALQYLKTQKGVQKMTDSFEDWSDAIKNGKKDVVRYAKTMDEIKDAYKDVFNTIDPKVIEDLNNEFLASPKMMSLMKRALDGDEQAWNDWEAAVLAEINNTNSAFSYMKDDMKNQMTELTTMAANLDFSGLTPGADIQDEAFISKLAQMEFATAEAAQVMSDNLSSVGVDAEIEEHTVTVPAKSTVTQQNGAFVVTPPGEEPFTVPISAGITQSDEEKTYTYYTLKGAKYNGRGVRPGGGSSDKGGGGGGGGSAPKHAEKKNDSDKTRYHTLQNQLEDLKSEYDSISEAANRAFGEEKLKAIDDEINKTDELINKQEEYIDAISENLPKDKAIMEAYYNDVIGGPAIEFDEKGNISNYDAIQDAMFAKYNQMTSLDEDSEEWQAFEKKYEQLEKYIEQYEETYDLLRDEEAEYQDLLRQRIDLQLEKVQYSVEIQLDIPENEIAIIEYQLGKIEDDAFKSAEAIGLLTKKAENVYDQIQVNKQGLNDLLELSLSTQEIIQLMNGDMSVLEGKTFTEDQIDSIKEYRDNLLNLNEELDDIRENVEEQVMEVFDAWNEKLEQSINKLDHYGNVLESYKNIIDIVGKDTLGLSDAFMATLNQSSIDNAINKVTATKKSYEAMVKAQSQAEQALEDAKARNDEASIKMWEKNLQSITEEAQSAREEMLSAWEDALNGIAEQFEATVERLIENFNDSIYKLGGLEGLSEDFSRKKETQDLYVSDYQKIYELSKLTRDINNKIDDTDNIAGKQKLKKLLEQINELQKDGVEMSQYDLEYLQAEYDLRLAELELEEARNAKNTVRLQRDNEGNWSYVYTQNTDAVDQAQQKYEDALYAMQDLSTQYIDEMSEKLISTSQEMQEAIAAVRIQDFESQDAYYKEIDRIYRLYQDQLGQQESELNKAVANNKVLYDTDWTNYHNATGYKISDTENFVTTFKDSLLGTLLGSDQLTSNFSSIIGVTAGQLIENLMSAANDYYTNLNTAMEAAGTSTGTFSDVLAEDVLSIQTNSEIASNAVKSMAEQMDTSIGNIMTSVEKWQIDYGNQIDLILNKNLQLINSFNDMIKVLSGGDMNEIDISYNISRTQDQDTENIASGDTGMYTGNWGTKDGKLAILHEKELVLNANDTENMLNMLELTRYLTSVIDVNAKQLSQGIGLLQPATIKEDSREILEQQVHIQAEFPNVNDHNEIEEAFNSLINTASQYAYRK